MTKPLPRRIPGANGPNVPEARWFGDPNMAAALHYAQQGGGELVEAERAQFRAITRGDAAAGFRAGSRKRGRHAKRRGWLRRVIGR